MANNKHFTAAQQYLARRVPNTQGNGLEQDIRPVTLDDALAIQQEMINIRTDNVAGWKCLIPLESDKVVVAPIFSDTLQTGSVCRLMMENNKARIEPEIAFVLNKDLPPRAEDYSEDEINQAIGSCHMALELMQTRFSADADVEFPERLADCLMNQGVYVGPEVERELVFKANKIAITVNQDSSEQSFSGVHPNQNNFPQDPVYWLINYMTKRGTTFKKGEVIITGSYAGIVNVDFAKETEITYQGLGQYKVTFVGA